MPDLLQYLDNAEETWIRVTTRRIKNEVASYIDNGLEVSIWLEGQVLLPTEEEPTVRRRRLNSILSNFGNILMEPKLRTSRTTV